MERTSSHVVDIPRFSLFGEAPKTVEDHYLHLEPLSDRSRPNNWNIRPHSHADLSHVLHLTSGGGTMLVEEDERSFAAPCALTVPAGVAHGFRFAPDAEGTVLTISDHYLQELMLRERSFALPFSAPSVIPLEGTALGPALTGLKQEVSWIAAAHDAAVEAHLLSILVTLVRRLQQARGDETARQGAQATLVARFRALIERHYRQDLKLARYIQVLGVTERQLRGACLKIVGLPPTHLIHKRRVLEAKRALRYSNMTIAEVAYYLGFSDPAYFSRFFAQATGRSPRAFRNRRYNSLTRSA